MAHASDVQDLGALPGGSYSMAYGVNAAGDVVVGYSGTSSGQSAFRWTAPTGMADLGVLPGGRPYSIARGVNAAGNVVVGLSGTTRSDRAFRWTAPTGMVDLGVLPGGRRSNAYGVNATGDVVVGESTSANGDRAFRWTAPTGMVDLGVLPGGRHSHAYGVNAAGNVVIGQSGSTNGDRAFRWTAPTGMVDLGVLPGGLSSTAYGVNAAGNVVVGFSASSSGLNAFRWTAPTGMVDLGILPGGLSSIARGVNAAGDVVVGESGSANGDRAFRWTAPTGMQSVEQWLAAHGVAVGNIATNSASAVNADGNVVVGQLENYHAFIARVTTDTGSARAGSGLIDVQDFSATLQAASRTQAQALGNIDLVLNGLHGSPLGSLLAPGLAGFWVSGDWGSLGHRGISGRATAGEVGVKAGIAEGWQGEVALGREQARSETPFHGATTLSSVYVAPGVNWRIADSGVLVSLLGYYGNGRADLERGYLNAGNPVISRGSPDTQTLAARVRVDWLNALSAGPVAVTPYTSLTWIKNTINGYTETAGGFPVQWDEQNGSARLLRVGVDNNWQAGQSLTASARVEYVHRLNDGGNRLGGRIVGLNAFSLQGYEYQKNWWRLGLGGQYKLDSTSSVGATLNVTSQSDAPRLWINLTYNKAF
ncbi:autotransporter domain-containing protein [Polaromonas sp. YR568]|uniref:autotransporter domain-containing protein n=1 Tax=Polaromonas sp. YR568 TaxID=1855301 RepID=UPI001587B22B|nr:autotransporter domain-containing protein [Polaromonas sp. YR568]